MRLNTLGGRGRFARSGPRTDALVRSAGLGDGFSVKQLLEPLETRQLLAVDLAYTELAVANNALPGGSIQINSTITNNGDTAADAPFNVKFYLSTDNVLDGADTELGIFENMLSIPATGTRGFPFSVAIPSDATLGDRFVIAVADSGGVITEANEGDNTASAAFFVGNTAPEVSGVTIAPSTLTRASELTLLTISATDADNITGTLEVTYWYDLDDDGVLSTTADRLIGAGVNAPTTPSYVFTGPVPTFIRAGIGRIFAQAFDGLDTTVGSAAFTLTASNLPLVQSLTSSPSGAITWGESITFTAGGVSNPDDSGTVSTASLYRESNGTPGLQSDDEVIGDLTRDGTSDRWTLATTVQPEWGTGGVFYTRATDSADRTSEVVQQDFTFTSLPPVTIDSLTGPTGNARRGRAITLTANTISSNAQTVQFFRDSDGNGLLDTTTDELLGSNAPTDGAASLQFTIDPAWGASAQRFFAVGLDALGLEGTSVTRLQTLARNRAPKITALTSDVGSASKGSDLTLTSTGVTDDDGVSLGRVDFYRDSNNNGRFDSADILLGTGTQDGSRWSLTLTVPTSFRNGVNRFFTKATDIVGLRSPTRTLDITITRNVRPSITTFTVNPATASIGSRLTFLARGVSDNGSIASVGFFHDSNNNGSFDRNTDTLIGNGNRLGSSSNYRLRFNLPDGFAIGNQRFFAVAFDNLSVRGSTRIDTVTVNA